jgi:hypothetical protein
MISFRRKSPWSLDGDVWNSPQLRLQNECKLGEWGGGGCELLSQHITISRLCRKFLISSTNRLLSLHIKLMVKNLQERAITLLSAVGEVRLFHSDICTGLRFVTVALRSGPIWNVSLLRGILSLFLMLVSWSASSCSLYLFVFTIISVTYTTAVVRF